MIINCLIRRMIRRSLNGTTSITRPTGLFFLKALGVRLRKRSLTSWWTARKKVEIQLDVTIGDETITQRQQVEITGLGLVSIPDANLRAAIEAELGKTSGAPITPDDMARLTFLSSESLGISDLTGLEFATNLAWLDLTANNISDISALSGLSNLESLDLVTNNISDISTLSGLSNLKRAVPWRQQHFGHLGPFGLVQPDKLGS